MLRLRWQLRCCLLLTLSTICSAWVPPVWWAVRLAARTMIRFIAAVPLGFIVRLLRHLVFTFCNPVKTAAADCFRCGQYNRGGNPRVSFLDSHTWGRAVYPECRSGISGSCGRVRASFQHRDNERMRTEYSPGPSVYYAVGLNMGAAGAGCATFFPTVRLACILRCCCL